MFTQILVRTRVAPLSILRDIRAELVRVDREQQVMRVRDLAGLDHESSRVRAAAPGRAGCSASSRSWRWRCRRSGSTASSSYGVATRTNEFGIRMALGARARDVVRIVLSAAPPGTSAAGLLAGVLLCVLFDNVASRWVTESSRDPLILGGVTVLLLAVAVDRRVSLRPAAPRRSIRWRP